MILLLILNIILIVVLIFFMIYIFRNKKDINKKNCTNDCECDNIENIYHKQNKKINSERVFGGRFVTDEEYQQMMKGRRSSISILLEEVDNEYEYLKELCK